MSLNKILNTTFPPVMSREHTESHCGVSPVSSTSIFLIFEGLIEEILRSMSYKVISI